MQPRFPDENSFGGESRQAALEEMNRQAPPGVTGGVPLGGLGTGKVELCADGSFQNITTNNNMDAPIGMNANLLRGCFFMLRVDRQGRRSARILKREPLLPIPGVKQIDYHGLYPECELSFDPRELGIELSIRGFSPMIPYNVEDSSIPAAIFLAHIKNPKDSRAEVRLGLSWENMIGIGGWPYHEPPEDSVLPEPIIDLPNTPFKGYLQSDRTGTYQEQKEDGAFAGLVFRSEGFNPAFPLPYGEYAVLIERAEDVQVGCVPFWDTLGDGSDFWSAFAGPGPVSENGIEHRGKEGSCHPAGAAWFKVSLEPGEERTIPIVLAWRFPEMCPWGPAYPGTPMYAARFASAWDAARYAAQNWPRLLKETEALHEVLSDSNLPRWLVEKLLNDLFPMTTCSYYLSDGRFTVNEAPTRMGACMGTMDQRLSSQGPYTLFFPNLDRTELKLFSGLQGTYDGPQEDLGEDIGFIPHDLGYGWFRRYGRLTRWPDLASAFVLQVYRHGLWTGSREFLLELYPNVKAALLWESRYNDGDIPVLGRVTETVRGPLRSGTTYDCYQWYGLNSFTGSLWLASLRVGEEMARMAGDAEFAESCRCWFERSRETMIRELWRGDFFRNYKDPDDPELCGEDCCTGQLAGEWYLRLMDMPPAFPIDIVESCMKAVERLNDGLSEYGVADLVTPDGRFCEVIGDGVNFGDVPLGFIQYAETYYACLATSIGMADTGLRFLAKIDRMAREVNGRPWNVGLTVDPRSGRMIGLPWYMTNTASWFILNALTGLAADRITGKLTLAPKKLWNERLQVPLFLPECWAKLDYRQEPGRISLEIKPIRGSASFRILSLPKPEGDFKVLLNGAPADYQVAGDRIEIQGDLRITEGGNGFRVEISGQELAFHPSCH